jgi:hypothetical protein
VSVWPLVTPCNQETRSPWQPQRQRRKSSTTSTHPRKPEVPERQLRRTRPHPALHSAARRPGNSTSKTPNANHRSPIPARQSPGSPGRYDRKSGPGRNAVAGVTLRNKNEEKKCSLPLPLRAGYAGSHDDAFLVVGLGRHLSFAVAFISNLKCFKFQIVFSCSVNTPAPARTILPPTSPSKIRRTNSTV